MTLGTLERPLSGEYDNQVCDISQEQLYDELTYLLTLPGNDVCADCCKSDPQFASITLGVFLCDACSKLHRALGHSISLVKSLKESGWTTEHVETLESIGNLISNQKHEAHVPDYYKRPCDTAAKVLREQWIRGKYQRKEFLSSDYSLRPYETDYGPIVMWKQAGRGPRFEECRMELTGDSVLYFAKPTAAKPKQTIPIEEVDLAFVPARLPGVCNLLQITITVNPSKPELWHVYAENGMHLVEWFQAFRAVKLRSRLAHQPTLCLLQALQNLTCDIRLEGWLHKTGPRLTHPWRRRWIMLQGNKLIYLLQPEELTVRGAVHLGTAENGFYVMDGLPPDRKPKQDGCGFVVKTPKRDFHISCESKEEKYRWLAALKHVTEQDQ